jgi:hypothetical protein
MSLSISMAKTGEPLPLDSLLVLTRTAFGLGIGMLMADKIKRPFRQAAAIVLVSVGALAAVPFLVKLAVEQINRPTSDRGSRARLRSIRGDSGYRSESDIY